MNAEQKIASQFQRPLAAFAEGRVVSAGAPRSPGKVRNIEARTGRRRRRGLRVPHMTQRVEGNEQ